MVMKVLVIDEISQLKACELDAIEYVVRVLTHSERDAAFAFAGRQLLLSGDSLQLEPVKLFEKRRTNPTAYEGRSWHRLFGGDGVGLIAFLTANHRQKNDRDFFEMLTRIRRGRHNQQDIVSLNCTSHGQLEPSFGHVRLCLQKKTAKKITMKRLGVLRSKFVVSRNFDTFSEKGLRRVATEGIRKQLDESRPQEVLLKQGARVMITRKIGDFLPGTICVVKEILSRPLSVSLSLDGNQIRDGLKSHKEILLKVAIVSKAENAKKEAITLDLRFMKFDVHRDDGTILASRFQLPVIPAYALTVHRSQGFSFDQVAIDFSEVKSWMPAGGAYVALSRCRSKSGLWVKRMHQKCVVISPRVRAFEQYIDKISEVHPHRIIRNNNSDKIWGHAISMPPNDDALCLRCSVDLGGKRKNNNMGTKMLMQIFNVFKNTGTSTVHSSIHNKVAFSRLES